MEVDTITQEVDTEAKLQIAFERLIEIKHHKTLLQAEESVHAMTWMESKTIPLITSPVSHTLPPAASSPTTLQPTSMFLTGHSASTTQTNFRRSKTSTSN